MNACVFFPTGERHLHRQLEEYLKWLGGQAAEIPGLKAFLLAGECAGGPDFDGPAGSKP